MAFELALRAGADFIESDIQVSRDGIPVLFHDDDLQRLTGIRARIRDLNLGDIKKVRLSFGGEIPTLKQALLEFPSAKFNLDIKVEASEKAGSTVIAELEATSRVLVASFSEASRKRTLSLLNSPVASSAGQSKVLAAYLFARLGADRSVRAHLQGITALQLPLEMYGIDFIHPIFMEQVLSTETELHYWTINDPDQMRSIWNLGAHGIVTDRTDLAFQAFS